MKLVRRKKAKDDVELNITAFLNLMVILIPFLLISAVFTRVTVLELNLPSISAINKQPDKIKLNLELVVRHDSFEIRDTNIGRIKYFPRNGKNTNWKAFTNVLVEIKARFPKEQNITLLLAPKINYKTLINIMDRVRYADIVQLTELETVELFPNISIGDAPILNKETSTENTQPVQSKELNQNAQ